MSPSCVPSRSSRLRGSFFSRVPKVKTMPTRFPNRPSAVRRPPSHRRESAHANPLYGYGYNPAWPSILSVAHDEADGAALFVITDRPCILLGKQLPLVVPITGGGGGGGGGRTATLPRRRV